MLVSAYIRFTYALTTLAHIALTTLLATNKLISEFETENMKIMLLNK